MSDDAAVYDSFLRADEAASVAHDFIYSKNGVTADQASAAIWVIHDALRPFIVLDGDDVAGNLEGDPDLKERLRNIDDALLRKYLATTETSPRTSNQDSDPVAQVREQPQESER